MLEEFLKENIQIVNFVKDWQESIKIGANPLLEKERKEKNTGVERMKTKRNKKTKERWKAQKLEKKEKRKQEKRERRKETKRKTKWKTNEKWKTRIIKMKGNN